MPLQCAKNDINPPDLVAKRLNNRASFLISTGLYEEGISLLTKALKLSEQIDSSESSQHSNISCSCKCCSLEACLFIDQDSFMIMMNNEEEAHNHNNTNDTKKKSLTTNKNEVIRDNDEEMLERNPFRHQHRDRNDIENNDMAQHHHYDAHRQHWLSSSSSFSSSNHLLHSPLTMQEPNDGFVYSRPILVNQHSINEGHFMGITLSLIILFNLSLAHHLLTIEELKKEKDDTNKGETGRTRAQQSLQLYQLAYQLHQDYIQYQQPYTATTNNSSSENENNEHNRSVSSLKFTMIISNNIGEIHHIVGNHILYKKCLHHLLSLIMYLVDNNVDVLDLSEMDGFYHNVSSIMMQKNCAQAA